MKRVGQITRLRRDRAEEYRQLHDDDAEGVRDLLTGYHIRNFSIYVHEINGELYEFAYYEYRGDDYDRDMANLTAEPRYQRWLSRTGEMQVPLRDDSTWEQMERVFFHE